MTLYQKFKKLNIDFSAIGLEQRGADTKYFCTPKGARVIGCAGVDGIHYCFVRGQGDMVFAVSPMNPIGENVFPIARTFEDLLRLLLACKDLAALEQVHQWDEEQFEEFVAEIETTQEVQAVFEALQTKLGVSPMDEPFAYLRTLQDSFNYGELNFSKEYYEAMCAISQDKLPQQWRVTIDGDFYGKRGKPGMEIPLDTRFDWGDENWHIPAVHLCSGGLVVDFCVELNQNKVKTFFAKYKPLYEQGICLSDEEEYLLRQENPLNIRFHPSIELNGELLRNHHGRGAGWISEALTGTDSWADPEAKWVLEHYGLDLTKPWVIRRGTFPWEGRRNIQIKVLLLRLERDKITIPVMQFETPQVGNSISFQHPVSNQTHTLTVQSLEPQSLDPDRFRDKDLIYPTNFTVMTYTIEPDFPHDAFSLKDCDHGDSPRPRNPDPNGRSAMSVGAVAVMRRTGPGHTVCSNLHFDAVSSPIQWSLAVRHKPIEDLDLTLYSKEV